MNNKQLEVLVSYGIYCLNRQENVLSTYRKIHREYFELAAIIATIIVSVAVIIASIWCAAIRLIDTWLPAVLIVALGAFIALLGIAAKATINSIASYKQFLAESRDITNTMTDITDVINLLELRQDVATEEDKQ